MHGNPGRTREFVREHLVYAAQVSQGGENGLAFGAVRMPGPKVDETVASLDIKSLMIIKPGAAIRLDVQAGNDAARVQADLERKITENQWKLDPNATTVLIAEMKRGEPTKINYRSMDVGRNQREESVTITPELSTVRIEMSGKTVWQSATSSGPPAIISLREGQTIQGEAARWQHPNPEFFDTVKIPSSIMDPAKKNGLGSTSVTNRGLVTQ